MNSQTLEIPDATRSSGVESLTGREIGRRADVIHHDTSPVFILGHGSSGTSILARLMREELGVAFGTESQFIIRYYKRLGMYGNLADSTNLKRLVSHLLTERWFSRSAKFGFATNVDDIIKRVEVKTYSGVLDAIFSEFASQVGMNRWGSKTPEYNLNLDVIRELFPNAKYVQMSRDGRDVFVSLQNRYWGPKNVFCAATEWQHEVELVDRFLSSIPEDRKFSTSYEELTDAPAETLVRMMPFLKIGDTDNRVRERIQYSVGNKIRTKNHGKWKKQMTPRQIVAYEGIACEELRQHGYSCELTEKAPAASHLARRGWQLHNRLRKYTFARYWADNAYKLRLRMQDLFRRVAK